MPQGGGHNIISVLRSNDPAVYPNGSTVNGVTTPFNVAAYPLGYNPNLPGSGTIILPPIDTFNFSRCNLFIIQTCPTTGAAPGLTGVQIYGCTKPLDLRSNPQDIILWAANSDAIPAGVFTVSPALGANNTVTQQQVVYQYNLGIAIQSRYLQLTLTNTDTVACSIDVIGDVG